MHRCACVSMYKRICTGWYTRATYFSSRSDYTQASQGIIRRHFAGVRRKSVHRKRHTKSRCQAQEGKERHLGAEDCTGPAKSAGRKTRWTRQCHEDAHHQEGRGGGQHRQHSETQEGTRGQAFRRCEASKTAHKSHQAYGTTAQATRPSQQHSTQAAHRNPPAHTPDTHANQE